MNELQNNFIMKGGDNMAEDIIKSRELSSIVDSNDELYFSIELLSYLLGTDTETLARMIMDIFTRGDLDPREMCKRVSKNGKIATYYRMEVYIYLIFMLSDEVIGAWRRDIVKCIKDYLLKGIAINEEIMAISKNNWQEEVLV